MRQLTSVMFDDLDDDMEPEAWPALEQRKLDESLRCAICGDLFGMPVSFATCTHTCAFPRSASPPPVSVISYPTSFAIISIYQYSLTGIPPTAAQFGKDGKDGKKGQVRRVPARRPPPEPVAGEPIPRLVYELRVYSLEEKNFGEVLAARSVRAAHCLTSIQFSPTSEHVLLAYGRRHSSLLLLIADGGSCITVHTILEVYRISDMSLVRVLPSAEDEVNVACFHPAAGGGLAYGTKEGRLRILRHDKPPPRNASKRPMAIGRCLEDELLEVLDWSGLDADADGLPVENSGSDTD